MKYVSVRMFRIALLGSSAAFLTTATVAMAQSQKRPAQGTAQQSTAAAELEEIVVVARKREENLQDVPISISAFSAEALEARGAEDLVDVGRFVPNVNIGEVGSGRAHLTIRGIGNTDAYVTTDPAVGVYVDGVYLARAQGNLLDLLDLERVEVLRGPQGTLFGKNAIGGAINIVSKAPQGDGSGRLTITAGENERIDLAGAVDIGLGNDLAVRLSGISKNRGCLVRRVSDNGCFGDENSNALRAFARYAPGGKFTADVILDYTNRSSGPAWGGLLYANPGSFILSTHNMLVASGAIVDVPFVVDAIGVGNPDVTDGNVSLENSLEVFGASAHLRWDVTDHISLHSISAYRTLDDRFTWDFDSSPASIFHNEPTTTESEQFSQEIRLDGATVDNRLSWTTGLYYFYEDSTTDETIKFSVFPGFTSVARSKVDSAGAFAHLSYAIADGVRLSGGVRYIYEKKRFEAQSNFVTAPPGVFDRLAPLSKSDNWEDLSPKIGVDVDVTDDVLVYASYSNGFRSGGFNGRTTIANEQSYDPESLDSYEVGFKSQLFDNKVRLNAAAFYLKYADRQFSAQRSDPDTGALIIILDNAAEARVLGGEAELTIAPTANLLANLTVGYNDSKFTRVEPGTTSVTLDSPFTDAPAWTVSGGIQYTTPIDGWGGELTIRADAVYKSRTYFTAVAAEIDAFRDFVSQPGYVLVNSRITYTTRDDDWSISLYARNITDKRYRNISFRNEFFGLAPALYGDPREIGISLTRNF